MLIEYVLACVERANRVWPCVFSFIFTRDVRIRMKIQIHSATDLAWMKEDPTRGVSARFKFYTDVKFRSTKVRSLLFCSVLCTMAELGILTLILLFLLLHYQHTYTHTHTHTHTDR